MELLEEEARGIIIFKLGGEVELKANWCMRELNER